MSNLFVYGTLCDLDLLTVVLGRQMDHSDVAPAQLCDHAVYWAEGQNYPLIITQADGVAQGILISNLSTDDLARLDFYEGGFGYSTRMTEVSCDGKAISALVYFPEPTHTPLGDAWSLADWQRDWGAMSRLAATEFMQSFGLADPRSLVPFFKMMQVRAHARVIAQSDTKQRVERGPEKTTVITVDHKRPYSKFFALEEMRLQHETYQGGLSPEVDRAIFVSGDAAIVLPYDPVRDRVLLVEQFRMGLYGRHDLLPWCLEPIAGRLDAGETPEATAIREAREEAGIEIKQLHHVTSSYTSPGSTTEVFHIYIGIADLPDNIERIGGVEDEDEDILSRVFDYKELMDMIDKNQLVALPTLTASLWLSRNKEKLRASVV